MTTHDNNASVGSTASKKSKRSRGLELDDGGADTTTKPKKPTIEDLREPAKDHDSEADADLAKKLSAMQTDADEGAPTNLDDLCGLFVQEPKLKEGDGPQTDSHQGAAKGQG